MDRVRERLADVNREGRVPTHDWRWAKASCWLDMARQNYHENDRSAVVEEALAESVRLVEALEKGVEVPDRSPAIGGGVRLREDLWGRAARIRSEPAAHCAVASAACLEVQLVSAGHEYAEGGWRHAAPYIGIAEQHAERMDRQARACPAPVSGAAASSPSAAVESRVRVERLILTTDTLFDFDRSGLTDIRAAGLARLDALAARALALPRVERIVVTGHADRLGDPAYNRWLSLQRAGAVRDHLVARGLAASVFVVRGEGAQQPLSRCSESLPREWLIACLQDDRRVEIEISTSTE
jgi:outer membrane protein OmpA-like peptidoglycan-associated protein